MIKKSEKQIPASCQRAVKVVEHVGDGVQVFGTIIKNMENKQKKLETGERIEIIQTISLLNSFRILRKVLEIQADLQSLRRELKKEQKKNS